MSLTLVKAGHRSAADPELPGGSEPGRASPREVERLVTRAQAGDVVAFERLLAGHQRQVYAFAVTFTGDREQAKDLAQEALVKAYRAIGSFRFQSSFATWLYAIVRNAFRDQLRSRAHAERTRDRQLRPTDVEGTVDAAAAADDQLVQEQERQAVLGALRQVPEAYREVLFLSDVQGQGYEEIASALSVAVGTVKSRLNRGREALRKILYLEQEKEQLRCP